MIRNDSEYEKAVERVKDEKKKLEEIKEHLVKQGLVDEEIARVIAPIKTFYLQLEEEVESYNKLKRGEFNELINLRGLGHLLIALRIFLGLSQTDLAEKLGVSPSQVSRDEKNEYHGISHERVTKILEIMGVRLHSTVELPEQPLAA